MSEPEEFQLDERVAALSRTVLETLGEHPNYLQTFSIDLRVTGKPKDLPSVHAALRLLEQTPEAWRLVASRLAGKTFMEERTRVDEPAFIPYGADSRDKLYAHLFDYLGPDPIDYLEFGVFEGLSLAQWVGANKHPDSRFYGFDSFAGLPEFWLPGFEAGHFDVDGKTPDIDDPRLEYVVGWFNETLPPFVERFAPKSRLVVNIDCDLYSSTLCVLTSLHKFLAPGSVVIFDELAIPAQDELQALMDYSSAYGVEWRLLATWRNFGRAAFERV